MDRTTVGLIGAGRIGRLHAENLAQRIPEADVRAVASPHLDEVWAETLGIPFYALDFRREFEQGVIRDFCDAYRQGRTPNPCARCNERLKFGSLSAKAGAAGAGFIATGHYVRKATDEQTGRLTLKTGAAGDDQSYFLYGLSQQQLRQAVLPLGEYNKAKVRELARKLQLQVHDKPKSQDLCFLPDGRYRDFLRARCPAAFQPGPIVDASGKVMGRHDGIGSYTVGQRRGLGIAHPEPLYVLAVRPTENAVVVGERERLLRSTMLVGETNWMAVEPPQEVLGARVKIRYNHRGAEAELIPEGDGRIRVEFAEAQEAPCPGQSAVFYRGDAVLGGGTIEKTG